MLLAASCRRAGRGAAARFATQRRRRCGSAVDRRGCRRELQQVQRRRARRRWRTRDRRERLVGRREVLRAEAALGDPSSARRRIVDDRRCVERLQHEHLRAREQRRVHLERRVLGRRADEHDVAGFDARQERVLLRLVEAVDLVDEEDRAAARAAARLLGLGHHLADLLDAREHRAERDEVRARRRRR